MKTPREKVVIVGAGMAGLTASAYLCNENYDVKLIERMDRVGGLVSTFEREGFSFDTGPRAFVNSGMVKPILRDLGIEWEEIDNQITIAIETELMKVESLDSIYDYKDILKRLYPENSKEIDAIIKIVMKLSKHTEVLYEFDNPYFVDYVSNKKVLFKEFLPWLLRLMFSLKAFDRYGMATDEFLKKITDNESLIDIMIQFFFAKTPTYFTLGYFQVYLDYFYLKGGTGSLPKLIKENVVKKGGEIILNTEIVNISPYEKKVFDSSGNSYEYDHLIWSCDLKTLYQKVDLSGLDEKIILEAKKQKMKVLASKAAESVFIMFMGVDEHPNCFSMKGGEHIFYSPSRDGLGEIVKSVKDELLSRETLTEDDVTSWVRDFCKLNTFEVSIPVLRDPELAPKGKTGIMISCLLDFELVQKMEKEGHIELLKNLMEDTIIQLFSDGIFEGIDQKVLFKFSTTPLSLLRLTGNSEGSIVGWTFENEPPVHNKLQKLAKTVNTPLPSIYKAGQWAYAPAGVPIAMLTAWQAVQRITTKGKSKKSSTKKND